MKTKDETIYLLSMRQAKKMLDEGIITKEEYETINKKMTNKYKPKLSKLMTIIT